MPIVKGIKLTGALPEWVSAKDIILELLRRHGVKGGTGKILEYHGPALRDLSAMDRHTIANMGAELGATTSVFPSDNNLKTFLKAVGREQQWSELDADPGATYDEYEEIDLSTLEPLIALPGSPGNVVTVASVEGKEIYQAYIGSSANPGLRDLAMAALICQDSQIQSGCSFDINPASRQVLETATSMRLLEKLIHCGARIHQAGCNGCIGMGQAPATGKISLRTVPRNFPGRSGTPGDQIYLCSPETAAASVLTGKITDPRTLSIPYPKFVEPEFYKINPSMFVAPDSTLSSVELEKGPNIKPLPKFSPLPELLSAAVLLKTADNVSTDDILPAGSKVLPFRSNIPEISKFAFSRIDPDFYTKAINAGSPFIVVGGDNYGQGSSREHAAIAPRFLGLTMVIVKSFARIHWQNLINFGILPLVFKVTADYDRISQGDILQCRPMEILKGSVVHVSNVTQGYGFLATHTLSARQIDIMEAGSLIDFVRNKHM